ncbi:MAG: hypothetical protein IJM92_19955 [Fibrobacter sp.]|uniref:ATP-grasp fold amidoligase family protein n=1 Tax=Fibrobacter sp. TaxID=35828 RepID=UPI0025C4CFAA|nr:ATP-grasp fold amidoligase family protein [Fibrobacter sp.]MBQ3714299.1 hypothetical protein [Fibrobacter sp.]MBQ7081890.1 hypothetical protein [Fibrobacter sp.]
MNKLNTFLKLLKNDRFGIICALIKNVQKTCIGRLLSDSLFIKLVYFANFRKRLNLNNPQSFNEKLQWLKLNDRNSLYTILVDKCAVKDWVAEKIGANHIVPNLGVWKKFDEINFGELPKKFVLKCTHDSGGLVVVKDKNMLDIPSAKKKIEKCLKKNFYYEGREWPYKNVPSQIIAEEFLDDNGHVPIDYKVYCFNGEPYKVMLCLDRDKDEPTKFYSFDFKWNLLRHNLRGKSAPEGFTLPKPKSLDLMYESAKKLSQGMPFVRVDFYDLDGHMYFGEMTFYPDSGFDAAILPEIDQLYGTMIDLNGLNK